jgi:hypothetical protein
MFDARSKHRRRCEEVFSIVAMCLALKAAVVVLVVLVAAIPSLIPP